MDKLILPHGFHHNPEFCTGFVVDEVHIFVTFLQRPVSCRAIDVVTVRSFVAEVKVTCVDVCKSLESGEPKLIELSGEARMSQENVVTAVTVSVSVAQLLPITVSPVIVKSSNEPVMLSATTLLA